MADRNSVVTTHTTTVRHYEEQVVPGMRLGWHYEADTRDFDPTALMAAAGLNVVTDKRETVWDRYCPPFNQGDVGSCVGNAVAGVLMTKGFWVPGRAFDEQTAVTFYKMATKLDSLPGSYPPDDTGTTGTAGAKAAKQTKYIHAYSHTNNFNHLLTTLNYQSCMVGVGWYDSFDQPVNGVCPITPGAYVRGGHEFELVGQNPFDKMVYAVNSWGTTWGNGGYMAFSFNDMERLLGEGGQVTIFQAP